MKCCTDCGIEKELGCFSAQSKGKFGVTSICKPCISERGKKWHAANRDRSLAGKNAYNAANKQKAKEYSKAWRERNTDRLKIQSAAWSASNPDKKRAATAKRRASLKAAVPAWANMDEIKRFYVLAAELTRKTGVVANVDHVVPLKSRYVCGLHCEANLSIMSSTLNKRKGNLWWPQMWGRDEELDL